jgi:hypothetical protein
MITPTPAAIASLKRAHQSLLAAQRSFSARGMDEAARTVGNADAFLLGTLFKYDPPSLVEMAEYLKTLQAENATLMRYNRRAFQKALTAVKKLRKRK